MPYTKKELNKEKEANAFAPVVKPPYEMPQKGFQGFRYTTKLF